MITIYKEKIEIEGACNFCSRGELTPDHKGLKYPYYKVYVIKGNQLKVNMCQECLNILKKEIIK